MRKTIVFYSVFLLSFLLVIPPAFADHPPQPFYGNKVSYNTAAPGDAEVLVDALDITGERLYMIEDGLAITPIITLGNQRLQVLATVAVTGQVNLQQVIAKLPANLLNGTYMLRLDNTYRINFFMVTIGAVGPTGPRGTAGTPGGAQGIKGDKGDTGAQGPSGGAQGERGVKGDKGDAGIQGETGRQGRIGELGLHGDRGRRGKTGRTGADGATGPTGATGSIGPSGGVKGDKGDTGNTGATGSAGADSTVEGPTGATGSAGSKGDKGDTGASSTVQGPRGNTGSAGSDGANGTNGTNGSRGERGLTGSSGNTSTKAWINFNGRTRVPATRSKSGIASVERVGTGEYQINFTTPFANTGYVMSASASGGVVSVKTVTTSSIIINLKNLAGQAVDGQFIMLQFTSN